MIDYYLNYSHLKIWSNFKNSSHNFHIKNCFKFLHDLLVKDSTLYILVIVPFVNYNNIYYSHFQWIINR